MLLTKSGKLLFFVCFNWLWSFSSYRENPLQVSLLVIDKKTNSKRKKKFTKISSSDPNVVLLYSEKMNPINEAEILEAKNNLKNLSANEPAIEVQENVVDDDAANDENNLKSISASLDVQEEDVQDVQDVQEDDERDANTEDVVEFDFPDNNSLLNETVEVLMEKRQEEEISSDLKELEEEEEEVDSAEVIADEAEEEILDEELVECSDAEISFKTASSTASISSNEKVSYFFLLNIDKPEGEKGCRFPLYLY